MIFRKVAVIYSLLLVSGSFAYAESTESDSHHEYHPNMVGVFVGGTSQQRRQKGLALGVEYERRLNKSFGIGALAERTFGDLDFWVVAFPFAYHTGPWKFYVGPGWEIEDREDDNEFLVRLGGEYGFEVGSLEIAPQVDVDFVDGNAVLVCGITFARGF